MRTTRGKKRRRITHFFLPHELNRNHPHIFRSAAVWSIIAAAASLQVGFFAYHFALRQSAEQLAAVLPSAVTLLTNKARADAGVAALSVNPTLSGAAQGKAEDMVTRGYFAHREPSGLQPWHWFTDNGYAYSYAGENLAVNFVDTEELMDAWLASPTHRENIMRPDYTEIGVGMATGTYKGREAVFVVQFFGRPEGVSPQSVSASGGSAPPSDPTPTDPTLARSASRDALIEAPDDARRVLGETTLVPSKESGDPRSLNLSFSPGSLNTALLSAVSVLIIGALVLSLFSRSRMRHGAVLNALFTVAVLVGFIAYQKAVFRSSELPLDSQAAAVARVL